jgi:hypothetical protein
MNIFLFWAIFLLWTIISLPIIIDNLHRYEELSVCTQFIICYILYIFGPLLALVGLVETILNLLSKGGGEDGDSDS